MRRKRTWKQRIGKRLMRHVREYSLGTLASVKANIAAQRRDALYCRDCEAIAAKLKLRVPA